MPALSTPPRDPTIIALLAHNEALPISRLPNEILENIFDICRDVWESRRLRLQPWISITYVCSRWRGVALGYSRLWSTISLGTPEWAKLCIARSPSECCLDIRILIRSDLVGQEIISSQIGRIRVLELIGDAFDLLVFFKFLVDPAPVLRKIAITTTFDTRPNVVIPPLLLKNAPSLVELLLDGSVRVHDELASLRHLRANDYQNFVTVLRILRRCPHLRSADIQKVSAPLGSWDGTIAPVNIPYLQVLRVGFRASRYNRNNWDGSRFLSILHTPSLVCLHLLVDITVVDTVAGLACITAGMSKSLQQSDKLPRSNHSIALYSDHQSDTTTTQILQYLAWPEPKRRANLPLALVSSSIDSPLSFSYQWSYTKLTFNDLLDTMTSTIYMYHAPKDVHTLTLRIAHQVSKFTWLSTFQRFTHVEDVVIIIGCHSLTSFIEAATPSGRADSFAEFIFPRLRTLVMKIRNIPTKTRKMTRALLTFVKKRGLANMQVEQLDFDHACSLSLNRKLYGKVNVTWKGEAIVPDTFEVDGSGAASDPIYEYDGDWASMFDEMPI